MNKFYITTAIHYINDYPHIGHMYENVVADVIARYRRLIGDDVFFLTGTDEHGIKIERTAAKQGILPIELADRVVADHHRLWKRLHISHDDFIRTTESRHRVGVYEIIRRIQERTPDDLYLGEFSGWYCANEEAYVPESQVRDGKCENGHPVERSIEHNYFFKLSRYQKRLLDFYQKNPGFVQPQTRFNEVISFVEAGLKDLSVSRTSIQWGIPWPGHSDHIIYVWLDALTNYISALGFGSGDDTRFKKYWPADVHLIGKDIVRFHAVYWPAFLMSAGVDLPKTVLAHGWWLRDNQKISKSVGNIVRPDYIIDQFGPDPLRFFLLRDMVFGQDSNYSDESFLQRYNADLANDLGNTTSRILKMTETYFGGKVPMVACGANDVRRAIDPLTAAYIEAMDQYSFTRALEAVWKILVAINAYIVSREPWRRHKEEGASDALSRILFACLEGMRIVWVMLSPFMPGTSAEALRRLGAGDEKLNRRSLRWGGLSTDEPIFVGDPLFPRVDVGEFFATKGASVSLQEKSGPPPPETTQATTPDANRISIDQFNEVELRVAEVLGAERIEKSKKLLKLRVTTGDGERTLVAGIATKYAPEDLIGRKVVIVANLQPATLMGVQSNGMVLAASIGGEPSLLSVDPSVPVGTKVK